MVELKCRLGISPLLQMGPAGRQTGGQRQRRSTDKVSRRLLLCLDVKAAEQKSKETDRLFTSTASSSYSKSAIYEIGRDSNTKRLPAKQSPRRKTQCNTFAIVVFCAITFPRSPTCPFVPYLSCKRPFCIRICTSLRMLHHIGAAVLILKPFFQEILPKAFDFGTTHILSLVLGSKRGFA